MKRHVLLIAALLVLSMGAAEAARKFYIHKESDGFCVINGSKTWPDSTKMGGPYDTQSDAETARNKLKTQGKCS